MRGSLVRLRLLATRVLYQLAATKRFLALSLALPVILITLLWYFSKVLPAFATTRIGDYAFPLGGFLVHFLTYILAALIMVRDRLAGTLDRMVVAGFRRSEIVSGYLLGYAPLAGVQTSLVLFYSRWLFDLQVSAVDLFLLYFTLLLLALISLALGLLLSNFAHTEAEVFPFIPLVVVPSLLLSGIFIKVGDLGEWWLSAAAYAVPLTYGIDAIVAIQEKASLSSVTTALFALAGYGFIVLFLSALTLKDRG